MEDTEEVEEVEDVKFICPIMKRKGCDGDRVSCIHSTPHYHIPTCTNKICSRLSYMSNSKPACVIVEKEK